MDYREFVEQVAKDLKDVISEDLQGATITARQVDKLQGGSYYGICVQPEGSHIGMTMNVKEAYEKFENGISYNEALYGIAEAAEKGMINRPDVRVNDLMDYDAMKETLMVQAIPTHGNEEMLAGIAHTEKEDMSLVYRFVFDKTEEGMASTVVTNDLLRQYDITVEQLHADAMENAPEHFPARIRSMQEVLSELMGIEPEMMPVSDEAGMFIATCNDGVNGAGCIFYPEFMDQAAQQLGGDFYILPSSLHEVILLPDNGQMDYHELEMMVQQVNETEVQPQDRLSDSVYHYDSQDKVFEKAEKFEDRKLEKQKEQERSGEKKSLMGKLDAKKKEAETLDGGKKMPHKSQNAEL